MEKYGRKASCIVKRYGNYGRKVGWIVKWYGQIWKRDKLNSETIWKNLIGKKSKLNSEKILKIWKKRASWIVKNMDNMEEMQVK